MLLSLPQHNELSFTQQLFLTAESFFKLTVYLTFTIWAICVSYREKYDTSLRQHQSHVNVVNWSLFAEFLLRPADISLTHDIIGWAAQSCHVTLKSPKHYSCCIVQRWATIYRCISQ